MCAVPGVWSASLFIEAVRSRQHRRVVSSEYTSAPLRAIGRRAGGERFILRQLFSRLKLLNLPVRVMYLSIYTIRIGCYARRLWWSFFSSCTVRRIHTVSGGVFAHTPPTGTLSMAHPPCYFPASRARRLRGQRQRAGIFLCQEDADS